ncbi:MAG TPA: hypothetical protein VF509_00340 [Sphingobium sp.]
MLDMLPDFDVSNGVRQIDPSRPEAGEMSICFDRRERIIRVTAYGYFSPEYSDRQFRELKAANEAMRARFGIARVLIDKCNSPPQSQATCERIEIGTRLAFQAGDRAALLVNNSLTKMQMRRVVDVSTHQLFLSEQAAIMWLKANDR